DDWAWISANVGSGVLKFVDYNVKAIDRSFYDAFSLICLKSDLKGADISFEVKSIRKNIHALPSWEDRLFLIVDDKREELVAKNGRELTNTGTYHGEKMAYQIPLNLMNDIGDAQKVRFSFRREKNKLENGVFSEEHLLLFKAFSRFCMGLDKEGEEILKKLT
ncbi:MAG: hypothetical protein ACKO9S_09025, partial [Bacteroidota bacterium]